MSRCAICGSSGYDGAIDDGGDYVCVDCWANGEAALDGRHAEAFVPADVPYQVSYPPDMARGFLDACNRHPR